MSFEFKLPDIGEGVTEGEIVKWLVSEGDTVREDQPIVEVMTDKATVEIASPRAGTIEKRLAKEGEVIPVGKVLVTIVEAGNGVSRKTPPKEAPKSADQPLFSASPAPKPRPASPAPENWAARSESPAGRTPASPATRKLAREMGVPISQVSASGPTGRVTREDVLRQARIGTVSPMPAVRSAPSPAKRDYGRRLPDMPTTGEQRIPLKGIRKKIAAQMTKSKHTAAHFTHVDEVDMTQMVELRKAMAEKYPEAKLTYLPFLIKAVCASLYEYPMLNAMLDDEKGEIVVKHFYNIGLAVATDKDELIVPVLKNADTKTLVDLSNEIASLAEKARTGRIALEDIHGGTFTISSMGALGGVLATPIINHPEVAILGFHKIKPTPVVRDGQIVIREMANLSVSLDHRVVDGVVAASFLRSLIGYLEQPGLLLLHA